VAAPDRITDPDRPAASLNGMTPLLSLDPDQLLSTTRAVRKAAARPDPDAVIHRDGW